MQTIRSTDANFSKQTILGMQTIRSTDGLFLSQKMYAQNLLNRLGMNNLTPCMTPIVTGKTFEPDQGTPMSNPSLYRSVIGALQYMTFTRPDIAYAVNSLSQFMHDPRDVHWQALKRLLRYVKGTLNYALYFKSGGNLSVIGFSDAGWGCCPHDRKSVAGHCIFLGPCLVSWHSKKQQVVSRSSTESEYRSLAHAAADIAWLKSLLFELGIPLTSKPVIFCDNTGAESLSQNPVFHSRTKHIEIYVHYVRNQVLEGKLNVQHISTCDQPADVLTKALSAAKFLPFRSKLNVEVLPH